MINSPMGVTPPHWLMAGVEHRLPLIHYWDIAYCCAPRARLQSPTWKTRIRQVVASMTIQNQSCSACFHRRKRPGQCQRYCATMPTRVHPPHLDPSLHLSGDGDSADPTVLEAYSK